MVVNDIHQSKSSCSRRGTPLTEFSGGEEANCYLAERGFQISEIKREGVGELLQQILRDYPEVRAQRLRKGDSAMAQLFERGDVP